MGCAGNVLAGDRVPVIGGLQRVRLLMGAVGLDHDGVGGLQSHRLRQAGTAAEGNDGRVEQHRPRLPQR